MADAAAPIPPLRPDLPLVEVASRAAWRAWLAEHHDRSAGVWAVTRRKTALRPDEEFVSARDLNEECLCFGWIDSRPAKIDDERTALLCSPRRPGSGWSGVNKRRLVELERAGLLMPPGLEAVERARTDSSWTLLDEVDALVEPKDLRDALDGTPRARAEWDRFPPSTRRGILEWILQAKRPATRVARIEETARLAAGGIRANQWPRSAGRGDQAP